MKELLSEALAIVERLAAREEWDHEAHEAARMIREALDELATARVVRSRLPE